MKHSHGASGMEELNFKLYFILIYLNSHVWLVRAVLDSRVVLHGNKPGCQEKLLY